MTDWDAPLDPDGDAYTSLSSENEFQYAIVCRHRVLYTNSRKRFKRHYRIARKRGLAGTWFKKEYGVFRWWRIRLSAGVL